MKLSVEFLKLESGNFDLECVFVLDLANKQIESLDCIENCVNLEILNLSNNQIRDLGPLKSLSKLHFLNLSQNQISRLDGIESIESLRLLNLAGNQLSDMSELNKLRNLAQLNHILFSDRKLRLSNPLCYNELVDYRARVAELVPSLQFIDGRYLRESHSNLFQKFDANLEQYSSGLDSIKNLSIDDCSNRWLDNNSKQQHASATTVTDESCAMLLENARREFKSNYDDVNDLLKRSRNIASSFSNASSAAASASSATRETAKTSL